MTRKIKLLDVVFTQANELFSQDSLPNLRLFFECLTQKEYTKAGISHLSVKALKQTEIFFMKSTMPVLKDYVSLYSYR